MSALPRKRRAMGLIQEDGLIAEHRARRRHLCDLHSILDNLHSSAPEESSLPVFEPAARTTSLAECFTTGKEILAGTYVRSSGSIGGDPSAEEDR